MAKQYRHLDTVEVNDYNGVTSILEKAGSIDGRIPTQFNYTGTLVWGANEDLVIYCSGGGTNNRGLNVPPVSPLIPDDISYKTGVQYCAYIPLIISYRSGIYTGEPLFDILEGDQITGLSCAVMVLYKDSNGNIHNEQMNKVPLSGSQNYNGHYDEMIPARLTVMFSCPVFSCYQDAYDALVNNDLSNAITGGDEQESEETRSYYINTKTYNNGSVKNNKGGALVADHSTVIDATVSEKGYVRGYITGGNSNGYNIQLVTEKATLHNVTQTDNISGQSISGVSIVNNPWHTYTDFFQFNNVTFYGDLDTNINIYGSLADLLEDNNPIYYGSNDENATGDKEDKTEFNSIDVAAKGARTYVLTASQMEELTNFLYTNDQPTIDGLLEGLKLYGENPINMICNMFAIPFNPENYIDTVPNSTVYFGSFPHTFASVWNKVTFNNKMVDICSTKIVGSYGDFRDFYSNYYLYLPYCGIIQIDIEKYYNRVLKVKASFDIFTGSFKYYLLSNDKLCDMYEGQINITQPLASSDKAQGALNRVEAGAKIGNAVGNVLQGNIGSAISDALVGTYGLSKPDPKSVSGGFSPSASISDPLYPYLIIETPEIIYPSNIRSKYNLPDNAVRRVGDCNGYLICDDVRISSKATEDELNEIKALLAGGVII